MRKKRKKRILGVQGQRVGFCRKCHPEPKDDKPWYHHSPMRAVYIRKPNAGFKRVGWYFEECSHVEIDEELVEEAVNDDKSDDK